MDDVDREALDVLREIADIDELATTAISDELAAFEAVAAAGFDAAATAETWVRDARTH